MYIAAILPLVLVLLVIVLLVVILLKLHKKNSEKYNYPDCHVEEPNNYCKVAKLLNNYKWTAEQCIELMKGAAYETTLNDMIESLKDLPNPVTVLGMTVPKIPEDQKSKDDWQFVGCSYYIQSYIRSTGPECIF